MMNEKKFHTDSQTSSACASLNCCGEVDGLLVQNVFLLNLERAK